MCIYLVLSLVKRSVFIVLVYNVILYFSYSYFWNITYKMRKQYA